MRITSCLLVLCCAAALAACGDDEASGGGGSAQERLDAVTAQVVPTLAAVDDIEVSGDEEDLAALFDAFADELEGLDGVEDVERLDDWTLDAPLPCGPDEDPNVRVLATGPDDDFFIGVASSEYVAGFAEAGGEDVGGVVAECTDGESGELYVSSALFAEDGPDEASVVSMEAPDEARKLREQVQEALQAEVESLDDGIDLGGWSIDDPVTCADGADPVTVTSDGSNGTFLQAMATDELVVGFVERDSVDGGLYAGRCEDGSAERLRLLALPLEEARELEDM